MGKEMSSPANHMVSFLTYPFTMNQGFKTKLNLCLLCHFYFDVIAIHQITQSCVSQPLGTGNPLAAGAD